MSEEGIASNNGCTCTPVKIFGFIVNQNNADHGKTCEKKKGIQWSEEEHLSFLAGLEKYGRGKWKEISKEFVPGRTSTQVASHAQKYYQFLQKSSHHLQKKRRRSVFHITPNAKNHQEAPGNKSFFSPSSDQIHKKSPKTGLMAYSSLAVASVDNNEFNATHNICLGF